MHGFSNVVPVIIDSCKNTTPNKLLCTKASQEGVDKVKKTLSEKASSDFDKVFELYTVASDIGLVQYTYSQGKKTKNMPLLS